MAWGIKTLKAQNNARFNARIKSWIMETLRSPEIDNISEYIQECLLAITKWKEMKANDNVPAFSDRAIKLNAADEESVYIGFLLPKWLITRLRNPDIKEIGISKFIELCIVEYNNTWK